MRLFIFILIILTEYLAIGQVYQLFPKSGKYDTTLSIKNTATQYKINYTIDGKKPSSRSKKLVNLVVKTTKHFQFRIRYDTIDTIISRFYLFNNDSKLPNIAISIDPDDLWNDTLGIYVRGRKAYWDDSAGHWYNCNYQKKWEKPVFATYIDTNNNPFFDQKCGLKLFGESTRRQPDKSMKLIARSSYGKSRFDGKIFPNKPMTEYKQIAIRTSGNDYAKTRFKDVLSTYVSRNLGIDHMDYQATNLYVNGEYWGVYNLREKVNEHFIAGNHNVNKDSVNIIMGRWVRQQGSARRYMKMYRWFENLDTMDDAAYEKAKSFLDIRNYINYRVFQIYINNKDSRGNIRYYNITGGEERFRMILYDTDLGWGSYRLNLLEKSISSKRTHWYNPKWSTMYLSKLMQNEEFKNEFATQFAHLMNTSLHKDTIIAAIDHLEYIYENELPRTKENRPKHLKKLFFPLKKWKDNVDHYRSYAKLKPTVMWSQLQITLNLEDTFTLIINSDSAKFTINENYALKGRFSGKYFKNIPLKITAISYDKFAFQMWSDGDTNTTKRILTEMDTILLTPIYTTTLKPDKTTTSIPDIEQNTKNNQSIINKNAQNYWLELLGYAFLALAGIFLISYAIVGNNCI